MLHTTTTIEYRDRVAAVVPATGRVDRIARVGSQQARRAAERAVDEVLADSFPASDPPSWNSGIIRPHPADGFAANAVPVQDRDERRTFPQILISLLGAAGTAVLFAIAILLVGLPIALVVRGLLDAIGWLFGVALY